MLGGLFLRKRFPTKTLPAKTQELKKGPSDTNDKPADNKSEPIQQSKVRNVWKPFSICLMLSIVGLIITMIISMNKVQKQYDNMKAGYEEHLNATSTPKHGPTPSPTPRRYTFPENGEIIYHIDGKAVAPFEVFAPSNGKIYYVLLLTEYGEKAVTLYMHAGARVEVNVPLGKYIFYYASGWDWYGPELIFGTIGKYYTSSSALEFTSTGKSINGHTVKLNPSEEENLRIVEIDMLQFPS